MKEWLDRRTDGCRDGWRDGCKYVCMSTCYSAPSRFLLRGAPGYSADTESEFHAEAHEQLRVKDLPRVPTRRLDVDSNPQPSGCKAPNISLHHRAPQCNAYWIAQFLKRFLFCRWYISNNLTFNRFLILLVHCY